MYPGMDNSNGGKKMNQDQVEFCQHISKEIECFYRMNQLQERKSPEYLMGLWEGCNFIYSLFNSERLERPDFCDRKSYQDLELENRRLRSDVRLTRVEARGSKRDWFTS